VCKDFKLRLRHFQHKIKHSIVGRRERSRKLSTVVGRCTHHLVTPSNMSANAAKDWATGGCLVECHVCIGKALLDHVHDLRHDIADLRVL
jgi:hypothetical protein